MTGYEVTEQHMREIREQGDLKSFLGAARTEAMETAARNRRMVLAHPDLAEQLTARPCAFSAPEMWTGYIGRSHIEGRYGEVQPNPSPYRAQLVALVAEAERRTREDQAS